MEPKRETLFLWGREKAEKTAAAAGETNGIKYARRRISELEAGDGLGHAY